MRATGGVPKLRRVSGMARSGSSGGGSDFARPENAGVPYIGVRSICDGMATAGGSQMGGASDRIPGSGSASARGPEAKQGRLHRRDRRPHHPHGRLEPVANLLGRVGVARVDDGDVDRPGARVAPHGHREEPIAEPRGKALDEGGHGRDVAHVRRLTALEHLLEAQRVDRSRRQQRADQRRSRASPRERAPRPARWASPRQPGEASAPGPTSPGPGYLTCARLRAGTRGLQARHFPN